LSATVKTRALMPVPYQIGLTRLRAPAGSIRFAGSTHAFDFVFSGTRLAVYAGPSTDRLRFVGSAGKVTKRSFYTFTRKSSTRATYYQVAFGPGRRDEGSGRSLLRGPLGCPAWLRERDIERGRQQHRPRRRISTLVEAA
jgi:hypothetical protein